MRYGWVPPWVVIGGSMAGGLVYVGVLTAQCYAHEPGDGELAPLGAAIVAAPATTTFSVGAGAFYYAPNMTGDESIKVVQPKPGQIALRARASSYR